MHSFLCATRIITGPGARRSLADLKAQRVLLVTDSFFSSNGMAREIGALTGATVELFDEVTPDPSLELVARGAAKIKAFSPDYVLALGGGSPMDCAKAMLYFSESNSTLVAIPTTSGSGAEVTDFSIITYKGIKHPIISETLRPKIAILDSELLTKLPKGLIADTGFDVLSHALEALAGTKSGAITDALALDAFANAFTLLPSSYRGDLSARLPVHEAATMAAMAFSQAGLGICHALSHSLGGRFHVPHGRLNAILLPGVITCNAREAGHKYAQAARAAGLAGSADAICVRNLRSSLIRLRRELGLPATLEQAGVSPEEVRKHSGSVIEAALADPCCATNPVQPTIQMLEKLLSEVTADG